VLETNRDGKVRDREIELKRVELPWMDRLMFEYPQGLNSRRERHDVERHMYYK